MKTPKTVDLSKIKIGQRLKRRDGCITTLKRQGNQKSLNYPFFTADGESHLKNGKIYWNLDNDADIIAILPLPKKVKALKTSPKLVSKIDIQNVICQLQSALELLEALL